MDDDELRDIQRVARSQGVTTAEWVRQQLRLARDRAGSPGIEAKLAAIQTAYRHSGATADIDEMLGDIERGYVSDELRPS